MSSLALPAPLSFRQRGRPRFLFFPPAVGVWGCGLGSCLGSVNRAAEQGRVEPRMTWVATLALNVTSVLSPHVTAVLCLNPDALQALAPSTSSARTGPAEADSVAGWGGDFLL